MAMKTSLIGIGEYGRWLVAWMGFGQPAPASREQQFRLSPGQVVAVSGVTGLRVVAGRIWLTGVIGAGDLILGAGGRVRPQRGDRLVLEGLPDAEVRME
jgi:hypothetical protein